MKFNYLLLSVFFIFQAQANDGFICEKQGLKISRVEIEDQGTLVIENLTSREIKSFPNLRFSLSNSNNDYQDRWGHYLTLSTDAISRFPYMPEFLLVFHMMRANKLYRQGFKALDGNGEPVKLSKLYCRSFIEALENY